MEVPTDAEILSASVDDPRAFSALYDRHAGLLFRFLVRRVGRDTADELLGETFRIAFERRSSFDGQYESARPWMYGISSNLVAKHRRAEARRLKATARIAATRPVDTLADSVAADIDARALFPRVAAAIASLPDGERDALLLYAWEELPYDEIAAALSVPVGTVRSRLNRARTRLRELAAPSGEEEAKQLRPDRLQSVDHNDPWILFEERNRLMAMIDDNATERMRTWHQPAIYPRLGYEDPHAAVEFLERVFGFKERRESRLEGDPYGFLTWLQHGDGVVMLGNAEHDTHNIHSPRETGGKPTCMLNVRVADIDGHYAHALAEGAVVTMEIDDAFYGERRYEAEDLEGNRWHFGEPLSDVEARKK